MADISFGAAELGQERGSSFEEFVTAVSGCSVTSAADWGKDRFELGLSGNLMMRVFWMQDGLRVNLFSTTNPGDIPPMVLRLPDDDRRLPIHTLERKLQSIRLLHAIIHLVSTNRIQDIESFLVTKDANDLDTLLAEDDQLFIEGSAPGSWYLTLWTKARDSYKSLLLVVSMVYSRSRESILRKLESEARLKELEVEEKEFHIATAKMDYSMNLLAQFTSPQAKQLIAKLASTAVSNLIANGKLTQEVRDVTTNIVGEVLSLPESDDDEVQEM